MLIDKVLTIAKGQIDKKQKRQILLSDKENFLLFGKKLIKVFEN